MNLGSAGIICGVCGRVADAVTEHRAPGPLTAGIADKLQPGPWRSRCFTHGQDRCWTAWKGGPATTTLPTTDPGANDIRIIDLLTPELGGE